MKGKKIILLSTLLFLMLLPTANFAQCAMCRAGAESAVKANPKSVAKGLNKGILFLMSIPYLVVGTIFRKDLFQFFKNIGSKEKTALNKKNLSKLTFLITFITCAAILFTVFISFYKPY